jgi:hypothetical protein
LRQLALVGTAVGAFAGDGAGARVGDCAGVGVHAATIAIKIARNTTHENNLCVYIFSSSIRRAN